MIASALTLQSWFDYEVQKQLDATDADIYEINVTAISLSPISVNLTVNVSFSNPHNLKITALEANFSIKYGTAQLGIITLPEMLLSTNSSFLLVNTTFHIFVSQWLAYSFFFYDLVSDGQALVNISGKLVLKAPALFITVWSSNQIEKQISLTTDLFTLSKIE